MPDREPWPFDWAAPAPTTADQDLVEYDEIAALFEVLTAVYAQAMRDIGAALNEQWRVVAAAVAQAFREATAAGLIIPPPDMPADPRADALRARQHRNTGPPPPPLGRGWRP